MTKRHLSFVLHLACTSSLALSACSSAPVKDPAVEKARASLTELRSDSQLGTRAPVAMEDAERAVAAAEKAVRNEAKREDIDHLAFMADQRIEIARAEAQARLSDDEFKKLSGARDTVRLTAREREIESAKMEVDMLRKQIEELQAKQTDRGLVLTLGDVLFEFDKADLKPGAEANLNKLVAFLNQYKDRKVVIEGHTDSTGDDAYNLNLSQRRADAVRMFLAAHGIGSDRITSVGKGKAFPITSNADAAGRQKNRRVEVIIENPKG